MYLFQIEFVAHSKSCQIFLDGIKTRQQASCTFERHLINHDFPFESYLRSISNSDLHHASSTIWQMNFVRKLQMGDVQFIIVARTCCVFFNWFDVRFPHVDFTKSPYGKSEKAEQCPCELPKTLQLEKMQSCLKRVFRVS